MAIAPETPAILWKIDGEKDAISIFSRVLQTVLPASSRHLDERRRNQSQRLLVQKKART